MSEYLSHWWNGDELTTYSIWGLKISQLNKIFKIAQYFTGLLAIFDIVKFTHVMGTAQRLSYHTIIGYGIYRILFNIPLLILLLLQVVISTIQAVFSKRTFKNVLASIKPAFLSAISTKYKRIKSEITEGAEHNFLMRGLEWLKNHPVSENKIKWINYLLLALFSMAEILTDS